ncbi:MAG: Fur family transcriptional regulator [Gammaproteobacteria bacterium]
MDLETASQSEQTSSSAAAVHTPSGRFTPARQAVIEILNATRQALTHHEIERQARTRGVRFDRVTLYRALDWLVANGTANKVATEDRVWRFSAARANHPHQAHFHCNACGIVQCLDFPSAGIALPVPGGFRVERTEVMLRGFCATCAS